MRLARIAGFRLVARHPERLLRFYAAIGFSIGDETRIADAELAMLGVRGAGRRHAMTLGGTAVDLDCFAEAGRAYPADADAASRCFQHLALVTDDVETAWAKARAAGAVPISRDGPVTLPESAGGVTAIKFRDPEGHPLEFLRFPDLEAKGWAAKGTAGTGMLGIDHSAVVATDRDASVAFYAAAGLDRGDASLNHGPTQAALDGIDDPRVDVVPMLPDTRTPHVELLHYRDGVTGRSIDWQVEDVAATRIVWRGEAAGLVRDPDGHLHQIEPG